VACQCPHQNWIPTGKDGAGPRARYKDLLADLDANPEFLAMLSEVRALPPHQYTDEESQMLQHMLVILRYAVAELRLVFAERGVVDFVELGLAARQVLLDEEGKLSESADVFAERWPHLLVDEFQDTSRSQYELFTLIAAGWGVRRVEAPASWSAIPCSRSICFARLR